MPDARPRAMPRLGTIRIGEISTADIMAVLQPIRGAKAATARRVGQRIGVVMGWAIAQRYRDHNPAGDAVTAALPRNAAQPLRTGRSAFQSSRSP